MAQHMNLHLINKYILWSYPMIMSETIILVEALRVIPAEFRCYRRAWKRGRLNAAEVLFLLIKYAAIVGWSLDAAVKDSDWLHSGRQCEITHGFAYFFQYIPVTLVSLAIAWRTYIIFQCNRKVMCLLALAVAIQLLLSMWTAFTQYRATIITQGFCDTLPKKPIPNWQHPAPWYLLYNFLYDFTVSLLSTRRLVRSTGGPRGVSQISRVLFYNNIHYMLIVCSCNFAEYVAMQTSREKMPSLLPISMAIQIVTAMNMLIIEQDLVHGHNSGRSNTTPMSQGRKGGIFSSRLTPRTTSSAGWNSHSARGEDTTLSKGTYGSTSKITDDVPPFHGIAYEQSKLSTLEDGTGRRAIGIADPAYRRPRATTGSTADHSISPLSPESKNGGLNMWSPLTTATTTTVGDQTFVLANTPRRPSNSSAPPSAAQLCTCKINNIVRNTANTQLCTSNESSRQIPGTIKTPAMSIRAIREQVNAANGSNTGTMATAAGGSSYSEAAVAPSPSFEISRGGPGASNFHDSREEDPSDSNFDSDASSTSPSDAQYAAPSMYSSVSVAQGRDEEDAGALIRAEQIRQAATSIDATNAGRAAASAMARLTNSRSSSSSTIATAYTTQPASTTNISQQQRRQASFSSSSEKEMLGGASNSSSSLAHGHSDPPALDLSGDAQEQVNDDCTSKLPVLRIGTERGQLLRSCIDSTQNRNQPAASTRQGASSTSSRGSTQRAVDMCPPPNYSSRYLPDNSSVNESSQGRVRRNIPAPLDLGRRD